MSRRLSMMTALSAVLGVLFSLLVGVQPANAYRAFAMCDADVVLITLRGTAEDNAPTGTTMAGLQAVARADRELSVWTRTVDYPAIAYSLGGTYFTSLRTGSENLRDTILETIDECPLSEIVLAGYSQGAQAIGDLLTGTGVDPLPAGVQARILSVALLADPSYRTGEPWNASGDTSARSGWFVRSAGAFDSWTREGSVGGHVSKVRSWCLTGDRFCSSGTGLDADAIHGSYATVVSSDVWNFLRSWALDED